MFLEVKFTQRLKLRPTVEQKGVLDVRLAQTAVQTEAVRTSLVVMSFGNSTASGGGVSAKHAATHFEGGSDELKPYDIGAALKNGDSKELFKSLKLISPFVSSPEFLAAMLGYGFGGYVDENGESHVWADHLHGRQSFETLEMRYRKLLVSGEDLLVSSGGVVEEVLPYGQTLLSTPNGRLVITQDGSRIIVPSNGRVVFKLKGEPGIDIQQFDTDDILRYTWRDTKTGASGASGYLRVKRSFDTFWYEAEVVSGSPEWLRKGMSLGQFGNYTKKYRQGFINISARDKQIAIWDDVDNHILAPSMLKAYLGDLRYVTDPDFPMMQGYGLYSQSCYLKGEFVLKSTGKSVEAEFSIRDKEISSRVASGDFETYKTQTDKEISSRVASGDFETYKTQTDKEISSRVAKKFIDVETGKEYDVESIIKQTPEEILLKAGLINLQGLVKADKIDVNSLVARNIDTRGAELGGAVVKQGVDGLTLYGNMNTEICKLSVGQQVGDNTIALYPRLLFFVERSKLELSINNGLVLTAAGISAQFNTSGITLPRTATVDMPGILMGGAVRGTTGGKKGGWGPKLNYIKRLSQGVYEIAHSLNHTDYFVTVTPSNPNKWNNGRAVVRSKGPTAFVVAMCDITSADSDIDCDFEFVVCGKN